MLIAYKEPSLMQYKGQSLLSYRYCVEEDEEKDVCKEEVNQLPRYSLIQYVGASAGDCNISYVDMKKVAESKSGKICYRNNQEELDANESKSALFSRHHFCFSVLKNTLISR